MLQARSASDEATRRWRSGLVVLVDYSGYAACSILTKDGCAEFALIAGHSIFKLNSKPGSAPGIASLFTIEEAPRCASGRDLF